MTHLCGVAAQTSGVRRPSIFKLRKRNADFVSIVMNVSPDTTLPRAAIPLDQDLP